MQPIRLNTICYWWLLILVVTVVTTSLVSGAKRRILKIERRALSDEEACLSERAKPLEYHIDLLLREHYGFGSIRGGAQILFRLDGDRVNTSIGQRITQSVMPNLVADRHVEQEEDYISMHMNGQIEFKYAEFRVSHSIKKLHKRGRGKSIHVKRIIIDEARQMISLRLGRKLPVGKYGILRVHYETADKAHEQHAKQDLAANQLAPRVLRPTMTRLRSGRDDIRQLFPCYDDPKYQSKFRVTIIDKLDLESNVVSNLHRDSSYLGTSEKEHYLFRKTNFIQSTPVAVSQLAFAVGPFANLTTHDDRHSLDPHHRPIIEHCEGFGSLTGYAKEYIADLGKWVHSSRFGSHLPASGLDPSQMLDLQHLSIKRTKDDNELGPSVESALTIALAYGRMLFATVKTASSSDSWITEGLSAHLAIRMVRELKPELQVDEFVRSKLLSWAKHYETEGNYAIMKIAYDDDDHGQGESTRRSDECILLWRFKCAALIDMIKRTFCQDQRAFDESVLALMNYYGNNNNDKGTIGLDELAAAFASEQFSRDDVSRFVKPWTELEGYPYIGVSLTKRGDSIRLDQVPINWLDYNHKHTIKADGVWPLTMRIKFHGSVKRKTHELPMREGFNGERDSVRVTLPDWLISGHKLSFDLLDQEELPYYRLSYSAELISKLNAQQ